MLDDELRALVSVNPSPEFQPRVRMRVASDAPRRLRLTPLVAGATMACAIAVLLGALWANVPRLERQSGPLMAHDFLTQLAGLSVPVRSAPSSRLSVRAAAQAGHDVTRVNRQARVLVDNAESQALQQLFGAAQLLPPLLLPEPTDAVVITEITITPLDVSDVEERDERIPGASAWEGDRQ